RLSTRAHPRHQPPAAARARGEPLAGPPALPSYEPHPHRPVRVLAGPAPPPRHPALRVRAPVRHPSTRGTFGLRDDTGELRLRRGDLPDARRHAPGHRAGRRPGTRAVGTTDTSPPGRPV